jgi:hypothetical protein
MWVAVYGCKHDASTFESLLKDMCNLVRLVSQKREGEIGYLHPD